MSCNAVPYRSKIILSWTMAKDFSCTMFWLYENIQDTEMQQQRSILLPGKENSVYAFLRSIYLFKVNNKNITKSWETC